MAKNENLIITENKKYYENICGYYISVFKLLKKSCFDIMSTLIFISPLK